MLHHDDRVDEGGDAVRAARTGEPGDRVVIVADAGRVDVAVSVDLCAADERDHTGGVMQPLVGLEADVPDIRPLHRTVRHQADVADTAGNLDRSAVHKAALDDQGAVGGVDAFCQRSADQRQAGSDDRDLSIADRFGDRNRLHFSIGIVGVVSH